MDEILVRGGRKLSGTVRANGSKNAGLPILAATLLADGEYHITNVPNLADIRTMVKLLQTISTQAEFTDHELHIITKDKKNHEAPYELVKTMRASIYALGPLLARCGEAKVSFPGGCALGARPIDYHLEALHKLGVSIQIKHGYIYARSKGLTGAQIYFENKTVGATANVLMAAVLAEGKTVIQNAACEPEISSLANFLNKMGAQIEGHGAEMITVHGVKELHPVDFTLIPDRIEVGTLLVAGAITNGRITVTNCMPEHSGIVLNKLRDIGFTVDVEGDSITIYNKGKKKSIEISTNPYPAFPTDLQPLFAALLSTAEGKSIINENIFSDRFMYISELQRLGADIKLKTNRISINGVPKLSGAPVMAPDIRAAAALVTAGLAATGQTKISRVYHLDRGYEFLEEKLQ
ncbi:MAG: UDP-N-acetylglucosamine 1-carboxyvinyltransferase, partial [Candidatus Cloacimonetes bacterium]|nr:UDP-N-acetylglucosamine 1-carboxyvinyltransferase [Candidatus Cloacimonadota bacterium]